MRLACVSLLLVALVGCAHQPLTLKAGSRSFTESDYEDVYDAWTRSDDDFKWGSLSDVLHVTATFEAWEFRWAYVVRHAFDHGLSTEARDEMLKATLADAEGSHRFFVTLAGSDFRESDLTGPQSGWRVLLLSDSGRQVPPVEIAKVRRPTTAEKVYFPSVSALRQAFRLSFPTKGDDGAPILSAATKEVILRFTGPRGRIDLVWKIGERK